MFAGICIEMMAVTYILFSFTFHYQIFNCRNTLYTIKHSFCTAYTMNVIEVRMLTDG